MNSGGESKIVIFSLSNQRGVASERTAQLHETPLFLVDIVVSEIRAAIRFGICTKGSLGTLKKHNVRFSSSLDKTQQYSEFEDGSFNSITFDHSSSSRALQPSSVSLILAPLEPGGRSLVARPSSLIRLISAET